jgi:hypothetical protein
MGYFVKTNFLSKGVHDLCEFYGIPVVFRQVLFQEKKDE